MDDLIRRQDVIDKVNAWTYDFRDPEDDWAALKEIKDIPSAQPKKRTEERTETHACDLISRQAAMELVKDVCDAIMSGCESWYDPETEDEVYKDIREVDAILKCNKEVRIALRNMPSAQPEMIREIRKWINSGNRGNADYFIVEKIEEIINKYE